MAKDKFTRMAFAKVYQSLPTQEGNITAISNRLALIEGELIPSRLQSCEDKIASLEDQVAGLSNFINSLLSHTHVYDDSGTSKSTQVPTIL